MSQLVQQAKDGVRHLAPFWKGVKNEEGVGGEGRGLPLGCGPRRPGPGPGR